MLVVVGGVVGVGVGGGGVCVGVGGVRYNCVSGVGGTGGIGGSGVCGGVGSVSVGVYWCRWY